MKVTNLELQALNGIANSDYMDGEPVAGRPVWSWSANPFKSKKQFSGLVTNLVRKGLAKTHDGYDEPCISLTQAGVDVIVNHGGSK